MAMLKQWQSSIAFVAAVFILITGPALAGDAKVALAAFGWGGTWSADCSLPVLALNERSSHMKAIRRYHVIPKSGEATETSSSAGPDFTNKIISANIVHGVERVLHMHYSRITEIAAFDGDEEYVMRNGKLLLLQGVTTMTARRSHVPRPFTIIGMAAGETIKYQSVRNGRFLSTDGDDVQAVEPLERCDDPLS